MSYSLLEDDEHRLVAVLVRTPAGRSAADVHVRVRAMAGGRHVENAAVAARLAHRDRMLAQIVDVVPG
jgi:hypothetical protein